MDKKTPLYDTHLKYGGKIVEFGGFLLPVQYGSGVKAEHMAVRTQCGLFDVSHMGEVLVQGEKAKDFLNLLLTNDYTDLQPGFARYSPMCNEHGGTVDDLIVYMKGENDYFVVVNAANTDKDFAWMCDHKIDGVELTNVSDQYGQVALQGPNAEKILKKVVDEKYIPAGYYTCIFDADFQGIPVMISRTGYTGEDGFEIYCSHEAVNEIWDILLAAGVAPCGLGCRDTLRFEAGLPLYGHELSDEITPLEAGLGMFAKIKEKDFIGRDALAAQKEAGLTRKIVGIELQDKAIPRAGYPVEVDGVQVGVVTTGYRSISTDRSVCVAMVDKAYTDLGTQVEIRIRKKVFPGIVTKRRFYETNYKK